MVRVVKMNDEPSIVRKKQQEQNCEKYFDGICNNHKQWRCYFQSRVRGSDGGENEDGFLIIGLTDIS